MANLFEIIKSKIKEFIDNIIKTYTTVREQEYEKRGLPLKKKGK